MSRFLVGDNVKRGSRSMRLLSIAVISSVSFVWYVDGLLWSWRRPAETCCFSSVGGTRQILTRITSLHLVLKFHLLMSLKAYISSSNLTWIGRKISSSSAVISEKTGRVWGFSPQHRWINLDNLGCTPEGITKRSPWQTRSNAHFSYLHVHYRQLMHNTETVI